MRYKLNNSFAWRVCSFIIPIIIAIFCLIMVWFYNMSREKIITASMEKADGMLTNMSLRIEKNLRSVSQTIDNTAWLVEQNMGDEAKVREIMRRDMLGNPLIVGCGVAYEPVAAGDKEKLKMIYGLKKGNGMEFKHIGDVHYYYPGMDWYLIPTQLKKPYWSEPYYDEGGGNIIMTTYSVPLLDAKGNVRGMMGVDISLLKFTDMVEKMKPFRDSYTFMLTRNGYYLTHKNKDRIMHETIFSNAFSSHNRDYVALGKDMVSGKSGNRRFYNDGKLSYAIYAPISNIGWSLCNVCSQKTMLTGLNEVARSLIIVFCIGIVCFMVFCVIVIKRLMKPLEGIAKSAEAIAHGNFEAQLPEIHSSDEIKELSESFEYMQHSLVNYMAELKASTAAKERIQSELKIAHGIQMGMIPKIFPPFPERADIDLHAILKPAKEVGGDLYDFFIMDEKLYFAIGDVSGKGIPASLFMAVTRSLFRNISGYVSSPKDIIIRMNDSIAEQNEANMFVTLFVGILDLATGHLGYCNAGHNPPALITQDGETSYMKIKKNLPVGLIRGFDYEEENLNIEQGTKLFCYTDGVVEAENPVKELYSEQRLLDVLAANHQCDVKHLTENVVASISDYVSTAEQSDDLTILIVNYKKQSN